MSPDSAARGKPYKKIPPWSLRSWVLAAFAAANVAACAALSGGAADGGNTGEGGYGAGYGGSAGVIDVDGSAGGGSTGDYADLCGRPTCDLNAPATSCEGMGNGGAGGMGSGGTATGGMGGMATGGMAGAAGSGTAGMGGMTGAGGSGTAGMGGMTGTAGMAGMAGSGGMATGGMAGAAGSGTAGMGGMAGTAGMAGSGGVTTGGMGGMAGAAGAATGGMTGSGGMGTAGMGGMAGAGGTATGGMTGAGGGGVPEDLQCKLIPGMTEVERACIAVGVGTELAPCSAQSDCGPGLGCVLPPDQGTGVCRTYCCGDTEACAPGTYCAPVPLVESADQSLKIPVCMDADNCTLLAEGQCAEGLMCSVVRADGTTACIPPGTGQQGEMCPCGAGLMCSKLVNQCRKICHTGPQASPEECDAGYKCQQGTGALPDGFGLCVSTSQL